MNRFKQTAAAAVFGFAALGLAGGAQASFVGGSFTVDETILNLGPSLAGDGFVFTANSVTGGYRELLTINPDSSFTASAIWRAGDFITLGAGAEDSNLSASTSGNFADTSYGLYVLFDAAGSLTPTGFSSTAGSISIWLDPNTNTVIDFADANDASAGSTIASGGGEDILVGTSGFLRQGQGVYDGTSLNIGSFTLLFDEFELTSEGANFFTSPTPFHEALRVSGNFDSQQNIEADPDGSVTFSITGSADGRFGKIPTPGVISLMGAGLLGLGFAARRREKLKS